MAQCRRARDGQGGAGAVGRARRGVSERFEFSPSTLASAGARRWLRDVLAASGLRDRDGSLELLLSEVVTNVVRHANTSGTVVLERRGDGVRLTVRDSGPGVPALRSSASPGRGGWGLQFVDRLADRWGVDVTDGAKAVWFELDGVEAAVR